MTDNRNINTEGGNYNENIQGNYIQGDYNENVNQSRNFQVGDVGGDFNPINSPIMSDNVENSANVNKTEEQEKPTNKKPSIGIIIGLLGILISLISLFASGLFNTEIRKFFHLDPPSKTQPVQENKSN